MVSRGKGGGAVKFTTGGSDNAGTVIDTDCSVIDTDCSVIDTDCSVIDTNCCVIDHQLLCY